MALTGSRAVETLVGYRGNAPALRRSADPRVFRESSGFSKQHMLLQRKRHNFHFKASCNGTGAFALLHIVNRDKGLAFGCSAGCFSNRGIRERRVREYGLRPGAGVSPLYPTRASAALYPVRAIGP